MWPEQIKNMRGNPDKYGWLLAKDESLPEREWLKLILRYMLSSYGRWGVPFPLGTRNVICAFEGTPPHADCEKLREVGLIALGNVQGKWRMYHMTDTGLAACGMTQDVRIRAIRAAKKFSGGRKIFPHTLTFYTRSEWGKWVNGVWIWESSI